jgi:hypothetical protein
MPDAPLEPGEFALRGRPTREEVERSRAACWRLPSAKCWTSWAARSVGLPRQALADADRFSAVDQIVHAPAIGHVTALTGTADLTDRGAITLRDPPPTAEHFAVAAVFRACWRLSSGANRPPRKNAAARRPCGCSASRAPIVAARRAAPQRPGIAMNHPRSVS